MPANTVVVSRPSKWGNPFIIGMSGEVERADEAVALFEKECLAVPGYRETAKRELRGKNLACWCKPGAPCHADVLLRIANA